LYWQDTDSIGRSGGRKHKSQISSSTSSSTSSPILCPSPTHKVHVATRAAENMLYAKLFLLLVCTSYTVSAFHGKFRVRSTSSSSLAVSKAPSPYQLQNGKSIATAIVAATLCLNSGISSSFAAIGEGDLPPGALAFQKVTKSQKDFKIFAESAEKRKNEIDETEVTNMKFFLKQLANEYFDMEVSFIP
jgi:hypothetical protein